MTTVRRRLIRHAACLVTLCLATPAMAQSAPGNLSRLAEQHTFSENDRAAVGAFVDRELGKMASDDAAARTQGRQKLIADLQGLGASRVTPEFRTVYAEILLPRLKVLIDGPETSQAINAQQVASRLGTDSAVTLLDAHVDIQDESRAAVRLWAAEGMGTMVDNPSVNAVRITRALRRLAGAARNETSWAVLNQQLRTLGAAVASSRKEQPEREEIQRTGRTLQADVLANAIDRMGNGQVDFILAIEPTTRRLLQQFLATELFETQRDLIIKTAPALSGLYGATLDSWDGLQADKRLGQVAGRSLNSGEVVIVLMDNALMGQSTEAHPDYEKAISSGRRDVVEKGRDSWSNLADRPAYRQ